MEHQNCHEMLHSLSSYVDGDLEQEICTKIERHLAECENCRIVVDSLRKTIYLYQSTAQPPDVPVEVRERLYRRLDLDDLLK